MASAVLLAYPSVTPASTLQSFDVVNFDGVSSSDGFIRVGLPFKYGDVSTGNIPKIEKSGVEVTAVQFDERTFWPDGSLRYCVLHMRDSTFSASESRTYDVKTKSGSYSNTATFATSAITGTYDLKAQISSLTQPNQSNTNNHTASLNTAFGTATRVTKIHSGSICDGWMVWQYYNDDSDSIDDAHLKAVWYVDIWNDGSDTDQGYIEFGCKTCLNNWDTASKDRHDYTLTLKNSTTTIETYSTIQHPYHAEWLTVSKGNDNNDGRRHWLSTAPTLYVKPDQAYWISTGLIPPLDTSISTTGANNYSTAWAPCSSMDHRANIDGTGAYNGRGVISNADCTAFLTQTAAHTRYARVNAHAGLHIPYHYRSTNTRDRSSKSADDYNDFSLESSDEANTIISLILEPKASGAYTFTSDGMPAAVHAYNDYRTNTSYMDGWVAPTGGSGVWTTSGTASHACNYSYFMYLLEGERHFMDATLDLAMNCSHQVIGDGVGRDRVLYYYNTNRRTDFSIPATYWSGLCQVSDANGGNAQERSIGWATVIRASGYAIIPDNDVQADCYRAWSDHNNDYCVESMSYFPTDQSNWGLYYFKEAAAAASPWMLEFETLGFWHNRNCTRTTNAQSVADLSAKLPVALWSQTDKYYYTAPYRGMFLYSSDQWHSTSNPFQSTGSMYCGWDDVTSSASADTLTYDGSIYISDSVTVDITDDDQVLFLDINASGSARSIPGGLTEGTVYYVVNKTATTFQVSATQGGSAVNLTDDVSAACAFRFQDFANKSIATVANNGVPNEDDYVMIAYAALVAANRGGNTNATDSLKSNAQTFIQNVTTSNGWYTWRYA